MTSPDIKNIAAMLADVSQSTILPRFRQLNQTEIASKGHVNDLVTIADQEAEKKIFAWLSEHFPGAALIGEESIGESTDIARLLTDSELAFIVDPIDGTWHFAHGSPSFATLIAVVSHGQTIAGINFEPSTQNYQWAIRGLGAFETDSRGTRSLKPSPSTKPLDSVIGCIPINNFRGNERENLLAAIPQLGRSMDYLCSAMEYRLGCNGALSFHLHNGRLNCWDHAAGCLIAEESGQYVAYSDGAPYSPCNQTGRLLIAESESRWHEIRDLLQLN